MTSLHRTRPDATRRSRTRRRRAVGALAPVVVLAAACGSSEETDPMILSVSTAFHGDGSQSDASPKTTRITATEGESAELSAGGEDLTVTIDEVASGEVQISTDRDMAPAADNGRRDLSSLGTSFTVTTGDPVTISTPSLDGYAAYEFTLADEE